MAAVRSPRPEQEAAHALPCTPYRTVTILFTDIEGSTRLLQRLDGYHYAQGTRVLHPTTEVVGLRAVDQ